jgi:hypothetical protein
MPAAVRIGPTVAASCGAASVWLSLLALAFVPLGVATVTLRHALAAIRLFDSRAVTRGAATAVVWGATTFVALAVLGAFLRATTHHHGLAGVAFGGVGLVVAAVVALFSTRFVEWCGTASGPLRWVAISGSALALGVGLAFFAHLLARNEAAGALSVDVAALVFAAAFGATAFPYRSRPFAPLAFAGPPLAAIVLVVGFGTLRTSAPLRAAVSEDAPVLATAMDLSCGTGSGTGTGGANVGAPSPLSR